MTLEERVSWAIKLIKNREKLNNVQLSRKLAINKNTVGEYSQGKGDMKGIALAGIVKEFGFNGEWLISGAGEPFPGAAEKFPEVCGPPGLTKEQEYQITESVHSQTKEAIAEYSYNRKINIDDAQGKAYRVLSAGNALSVTLYMNIQQFAAALDTSQELKTCQDQLKDMQSQIDTLREQVDRLTAAPSTSRGQGDGSDEKVA